MYKIGIVGISGYSGYVALEILLRHPQVRVTYVSANNTTGKVSEIWPKLNARTALYCEQFNINRAVALCDVIFLAVPHTTSMLITPKLLKAKKRVIDLSGDYRLKSPGLYKKWYAAKHTDTVNLKKAVYGLPEIYREAIRKANLVANPGCYPTAALLGLAPLATIKTNSINSIIIDAKSGVTGAGKKMTASLMFPEVNENFKAYKVLSHQHNPEINQYLSSMGKADLEASFVAHLLPLNQGILETIYVQLKSGMSLSDVHTLYAKFYKTEKFVRVLKPPQQPETKNVVNTNFCDIGLAVDQAKKLIVITSAIDNLYKGAAAQAVQNMNIMCQFKETEGLI